MPNNKKLSLKKIKNSDTAHPYSRKAKQMQRSINRSDKLVIKLQQNQAKSLPKAEKFMWFRQQILKMSNQDQDQDQDQNIMDTSVSTSTTKSSKNFSLDKPALKELCRKFLGRNDTAIERIRASRRPNRALNPKDELFIASVQTEKKEAASAGLEVPALTESSTVAALKQWDGDLNAITLIRSTRIVIS